MRIISELSGLRRESTGDAIGTYGNAGRSCGSTSMMVCGMKQQSSGAAVQAENCRSCKSGQSEFGGLQHASRKIFDRFVLTGGSVCGAGLDQGNSCDARGPQARRAQESLRQTAQGLSQLGRQRKSRVGKFPDGKSPGFARLREGEQEGAVGILELAA